MFKQSSLKEFVLSVETMKLSTEKQRTLKLISAPNFYTIKQISKARNVSIRQIQKDVKFLKDNGFLNPSNQTRYTTGYPNKNELRLHGEGFNIRLLNTSERYFKLLKKNPIMYIENHAIRLHKSSINVYSNKSFVANDTEKVNELAIRYWDLFFSKLEHKLGILIKKTNCCNIFRFKAHYSEVNNEIARECNKKGEKLKIYAKEDGKLWFMIDNSLNLNEAETQHRITASEDMNKIKHFLNDLRTREDYTNFSDLISEQLTIQKNINLLVNSQISTQNQLKILLKALSPENKRHNIPKEDIKPATFGIG